MTHWQLLKGSIGTCSAQCTKCIVLDWQSSCSSLPTQQASHHAAVTGCAHALALNSHAFESKPGHIALESTTSGLVNLHHGVVAFGHRPVLGNSHRRHVPRCKQKFVVVYGTGFFCCTELVESESR